MSAELAVMAPADVPDDLVEIGVMAICDATPAEWADTEPAVRRGVMERHGHDVRQALAAVLPLYGASIIAGAGVEHYNRQVELAQSLTTRVYGSSLLITIANEATAAANAGIEPELNRKLADMLRKRAHQEGAP